MSHTAAESREALPCISVNSEEFLAWRDNPRKDVALLMDGLANQDLSAYSLEQLRARCLDIEVKYCKSKCDFNSFVHSLHSGDQIVQQVMFNTLATISSMMHF